MEDKVLEIKDKMSDIVTAADVTDIRLTQAGYYWDAGYNEFDFSCKINGEIDILHMVQQRHDDGYGLVIRAEKNDMWDRITGSEAFRLTLISMAIAIYFGDSIKTVLPINLLYLLLLVQLVYVVIRWYVKGWRNTRGYY